MHAGLRSSGLRRRGSCAQGLPLLSGLQTILSIAEVNAQVTEAGIVDTAREFLATAFAPSRQPGRGLGLWLPQQQAPRCCFNVCRHLQ
jgi:hypothetical protein